MQVHLCKGISSYTSTASSAGLSDRKIPSPCLPKECLVTFSTDTKLPTYPHRWVFLTTSSMPSMTYGMPRTSNASVLIDGKPYDTRAYGLCPTVLRTFTTPPGNAFPPCAGLSIIRRHTFSGHISICRKHYQTRRWREVFMLTKKCLRNPIMSAMRTLTSAQRSKERSFTELTGALLGEHLDDILITC